MWKNAELHPVRLGFLFKRDSAEIAIIRNALMAGKAVLIWPGVIEGNEPNWTQNEIAIVALSAIMDDDECRKIIASCDAYEEQSIFALGLENECTRLIRESLAAYRSAYLLPDTTYKIIGTFTLHVNSC